MFFINKKRGGLFYLFCYIFRVSYIAVNYRVDKQPDIYKWANNKRRFNKLVNHAVFTYISSISQTSVGYNSNLVHQLTIELISEYISNHYKRRTVIYLLSIKLSKIYSSKLFAIFSFIFLLYDELASILHALLSLAIKYNLLSNEISKNIDISIGFPKHSYNLPVEELNSSKNIMQSYSSFGEYLATKNKKSDISHVSINEYERNSKAREDSADNHCEGYGKILNEYSRILTTKKISVGLFSRLSFKVIATYLRFANRDIPVTTRIKYFKQCAISEKYIGLIKRLKKTGYNVRTIYCLPFSNIGIMRYIDDYSYLIKDYSYSHNIYIPPRLFNKMGLTKSFATDISFILEETQLAVFCLISKSVGFTNIYNDVDLYKTIINKKYNIKLRSSNTHKAYVTPSVLGFETVCNRNNFSDMRPAIGVFDVPPESLSSQLSRAILGDMSCDIEIVESFLKEVVETGVNNGYCVAFKPKYSLKNYDKGYELLIKKMEKKYNGQFIILNPYENLTKILSLIEVCISYPYTSTKIIAEYYGKPSAYYMPQKYGRVFIGDNDTLCGKSDLKDFLKSNLF